MLAVANMALLRLKQVFVRYVSHEIRYKVVGGNSGINSSDISSSRALIVVLIVELV